MTYAQHLEGASLSFLRYLQLERHTTLGQQHFELQHSLLCFDHSTQCTLEGFERNSFIMGGLLDAFQRHILRGVIWG